MTNNFKYTVMTFEQRIPAGMATLIRGKWFYYEIGINNVVTLTGYRAGTREDVEQVVRSIIERLNRDHPVETTNSVSSRLTFPSAPRAREDEEGNMIEEEDLEEEDDPNPIIITEEADDAVDHEMPKEPLEGEGQIPLDPTESMVCE